MTKDLRSFLALLEQEHPGELVCIEREVHPDRYELLAFVETFEKMGRFPAILFQHVTTLRGERWPGGMVVSIDPGTYRRAAIALGLDTHRATAHDAVTALARGIQSPVKAEPLPAGQAPVQEVVLRGEEADLADLPLIMHYEHDMRPGWMTPVVAVRDPVEGRYNLSYHRIVYKGPRRVTVQIAPGHLQESLSRAQARGEPLPVALVVGHHPAFYMASGARPSWTFDEYEVVGGALGEPLRVVPSVSFGSDLMVPADAELVVEARILPDQVEPEGPFGEWTRYYGPQDIMPVAEVTAITRRRDALFQAIRASYHIIEDMSHSAGLLALLKTRFPSVRSVNAFFHTWAIISMEKSQEGEPMRVASMALAYGRHVKHAVIVDADVDPFNLQQVLWAIGVRLQPHERVKIIDNIALNTLDPSLTHPHLGSVMVIDATESVDRPFQQAISMPRDVLERIQAEFESYVPREKLARVAYGDPWRV